MKRTVFILLLLIINITYASQVVLITGASRGIGLKTATLLAKSDYTVYAGVRKITPELQNLENQNPHLHLVILDVTDDESVQKCLNSIIDKEKRVDVLINNAGILHYGSIENETIDEAKQIFETNYFGPVRMMKAILPQMRAQKSGRIIQISSRSGFRPLPTLTHYAASKFALEGMSETMAATLTPWNIQISLVEPGPVNTDLDYEGLYGTEFAKDSDPYYPYFSASGLLEPGSPYTQQPDEIAQLVKEIIESKEPHFRYQTTPAIQKQAGLRFVDITGDSGVKELQSLLFSQ